jgi:integrase
LGQSETVKVAKHGKTLMAKQRFSKTDHRYWISKVFKAAGVRNGKRMESPIWSVRLQHETGRTTFPLDTSNREAASARARDIYMFMQVQGWEAALREFKGGSFATSVEKKPGATIGEFLAELKNLADLKAKTFEGYAGALRTIASQIFGIDGGKQRYDYRSGGRRKWIENVHAVKLADLTALRIQTWKREFLARAGSDPVKLRTAKISVNSLIRRAKSLFTADCVRHLQRIQLPSPLPFDGVAFEPRVSQRYHSTIDIEALIADARRELQETQPELFKVFVLASFCGLRRLEIDRLTWPAFRFNEGILRIAATKHFSPKSEDSIGDVVLEPELVELFRGYRAKASGEFVIESPNMPRPDALYENYRCQAIFEAVINWLRIKGVATKTPLHTLRKEFGSLINKAHGIHAASLALRHANIGVTSLHYVDSRPRATTGLGGLLSEKVQAAKFAPKTARRD